MRALVLHLKDRNNMANEKITISQILAIKGGTLEELCQYAQEKGVVLPNDPNYSLSSSELNAIDPQLAFNMKRLSQLARKTKLTSQKKNRLLFLQKSVIFRMNQKRNPK